MPLISSHVIYLKRKLTRYSFNYHDLELILKKLLFNRIFSRKPTWLNNNGPFNLLLPFKSPICRLVFRIHFFFGNCHKGKARRLRPSLSLSLSGPFWHIVIALIFNSHHSLHHKPWKRLVEPVESQTWVLAGAQKRMERVTAPTITIAYLLWPASST